MAFGNITTIYFPVPADAGTSQWGSDVRKMTNSPAGAFDGSTVTDHATGGVVVRTLDPYTTKATDDTQANFGWAITPTDMGSVTGALRYYPAGNHVARAYVGHSGALATNGTMTMYVYKVGAAGNSRARTLLASGSVVVSYPAAAATTIMTLSVAVPEVVFQPDETIQYSFELSSAGVAVVGRTCQFYTGTDGVTPSQITTPKLGVLADTTGSATGIGTLSGVTGNVLNTTGSADGSTIVSGVGASRADTVGTASGIGSAVGAGSSVASTTGNASGIGIATGLSSIVRGTIGTVIIGGGGSGNATTYVYPIFD